MILLLALVVDALDAPAAAPSHFSDPVVIAMIGTQLCLVIAAIVQGTLSILARSDRKDAAARLDTVAKDTEAIKGHVNSEKTASDGREHAKDIEIALLRESLTHEKSNAALLAQAVATRARIVDPIHLPLEVAVVNTPLEIVAKKEEGPE